jgi:hypothetical protein
MVQHFVPSTHAAIPIDPAHEIDAKRTVIWVAIFVVVVFGSLWLLLQAFGFFLFQEQKHKIFERPAYELEQKRAAEQAELPIDEAMRRLATKK